MILKQSTSQTILEVRKEADLPAPYGSSHPVYVCRSDEGSKHGMSSVTVSTSAGAARNPIAPWWHTVLVLAALAGLSVASWYQNGLPNAHLPGVNSRLSGYFTVLVAEWLVIFLIWLALRRRGLSVGSLVSGRWPTAGAFFRDLGLAAGFFVVVAPSLGLLADHFASYAASAEALITPKTTFELVVWVGLSATAGFCEEFIFRGYLVWQFSAWSGSRFLAIALQAVVFGLCHGYYHAAMMVFVMLQGLLLGLLAYWRKSLRPGMLAHGLQDTIGGVVAFVTKA